MTDEERARARAGQKAALIIVASGLFWVGAIVLGDRMDLSTRERALLDLFALAGFGYGVGVTRAGSDTDLRPCCQHWICLGSGVGH